jgi:5-methylcytosine-specific restriction protein A
MHPKPYGKGRARETHGRIQGRAGMALRARRLANEPLCRMCRDKGITRAATAPDHIKPLALGGTDTDDNIRCLCADCHREVTAEQFGHRRVQGTGLDGWPT